MFSKWFDTSGVAKVADTIAESLRSNLPPGEANDPRRKSSARFTRARSAIFAELATLSEANALNFYQKAQFGLKLKSRLYDVGYPKAFVDSFTLELISSLTKAGGTATEREQSGKLAESRLKSLVEGLDHAEDLFLEGKVDASVAILKKLLKSAPQDFAVLYRYGLVATHFDEKLAFDLFEKATNTNGPIELALLELGKLCASQSRFSTAEDYFRRAVSISPRSAELHNWLGLSLQFQEKLTEALRSFTTATKCADGNIAFTNLGMTQLRLGHAKQGIESLRKAVALEPSNAVAASNYLFGLSHFADASPAFLFEEHASFGARFESQFRKQWSGHQNERSADRALRVGFVSGDLFKHAVATFVEPIWETLDKSKFEIYAYSNIALQDEVSMQLKRHTKQWFHVDKLTDDQCFDRIKNDKIDILIDLSGHTANNRLLVFARKPAPIQVSWIGNPSTTGLASMDYYIANPFSAPPGLLDDQFTEKLVQLPSAPPFQPYRKSPQVSTLPALSNGYVTFGSFSRPDKISGDVIRLWAKVLASTPGSRMLLVGHVDQARMTSIQKQFESSGIEKGRITFHERCEISKYLGLHSRVDIILDTFPFSGGTTSCHAAWMGVPVITLVGNTLAARTGAVVNGNLGLEELTCPSESQFIECATALASDLARLDAMRKGLRTRMEKSSMRNPRQVSRWLETSLRHMWATWCDADPAHSFRVEAIDGRAMRNG